MKFRPVAIAALLLLFTACGSNAVRWEERAGRDGARSPASKRSSKVPATHKVVRGDTLYSIAFRYGLDHRELSRWNRLGNGALIYPGQVIRLRSGARTTQTSSRQTPAKRQRPAPRPDAAAPKWIRPVSGGIVAEFGSSPATQSGVLFRGTLGEPVRAAAAGKVVYSGSGLIGYGRLIIVKHNETYLSAYGHNAQLLVAEGENVKQNQQIAKLGKGPGQQPRLHFEIRRNGKPVNPSGQLPLK